MRYRGGQGREKGCLNFRLVRRICGCRTGPGGLSSRFRPMRTATRWFQTRFAFVTVSLKSAIAAPADNAELTTAAGGRRSRRTHDRRGGQLVPDAQNGCKSPTNCPEEPNFPPSQFALHSAGWAAWAAGSGPCGTSCGTTSARSLALGASTPWAGRSAHVMRDRCGCATDTTPVSRAERCGRGAGGLEGRVAGWPGTRAALGNAAKNHSSTKVTLRMTL